jgi:hypothetical protein
VLGKQGLAGALRAAARKHKWRRIAVGAEQVGDIGISELRGVQASMICRASGWFIGRTEFGMTMLPSRDIRIMWSVV